jgi:hypothetical protein
VGLEAGELDAPGLWLQAISRFEGMVADCASHFVDAANFAPNRLVVTFPSSYTSSKSFCERPERLFQMEKTLSEVAGRKIKLEFSLRADAATGNPAEPAISARQREREVSQRPFVQQAAELFSGNVTGVVSPLKRNDR